MFRHVSVLGYASQSVPRYGPNDTNRALLRGEGERGRRSRPGEETRVLPCPVLTDPAPVRKKPSSGALADPGPPPPESWSAPNNSRTSSGRGVFPDFRARIQGRSVPQGRQPTPGSPKSLSCISDARRNRRRSEGIRQDRKIRKESRHPAIAVEKRVYHRDRGGPHGPVPSHTTTASGSAPGGSRS